MDDQPISSIGIPVVDLSSCSVGRDRGTEEWHQLCTRVREACETYGCVEVVYDKIPSQLRDDTFALIRQLFELPSETKRKNTSPKPFHSYEGDIPMMPLYESTNIGDASNCESLRSFTELMWPDGHQQFSKTIGSVVNLLEELNQTICCLILDSYGLGGGMNSIMECTTLFRMIKYKAPPNGNTTEGLTPHVDKDMCTLLAGDGVSGLEIETKDGKWVELFPSANSYTFMVGDALMVWSNRRLRGVNHRVTMSGDKERYTFGAFSFPVDGTIVKPAKELVDEDHPPLFKEFNYTEFLNFSYTYEAFVIGSDKLVQAFAGSGN